MRIGAILFVIPAKAGIYLPGATCALPQAGDKPPRDRLRFVIPAKAAIHLPCATCALSPGGGQAPALRSEGPSFPRVQRQPTRHSRESGNPSSLRNLPTSPGRGQAPVLRSSANIRLARAAMRNDFRNHRAMSAPSTVHATLPRVCCARSCRSTSSSFSNASRAALPFSHHAPLTMLVSTPAPCWPS